MRSGCKTVQHNTENIKRSRQLRKIGVYEPARQPRCRSIPTTMTSPVGIDPFDQARVRVWEKLTPKERDKCAETNTINDIWKAIQETQEKQSKLGMLGNMNKIRPYLDGLQRYAKVIEVFVQVNPAILALIWLSSHYFQGYDKLLDVFHEIGSSFPQFQQIADIFQGSSQMANYFGLFYAEIIEFHYQALRFFRQTRWKALFEVLWPRYEDIFTVIQRNIEKHKDLIDRQVTILVIKEARREKRDFREFCTLEKNIPYYDYKPRLYDVERKHCAETGKWVFSDPRFQSWLNASSSEAKQRLLWLAGVPGAGKTFLCYSILQYLLERVQADGSTCVLYAFPTYDDTSGNTLAAITGSLVYQICQKHTPLIPAANQEYDTLSRNHGGLLINPWGKLLETFIC
ncbi:hypothetical protein BDD12DRAFT_827786 [Trichophaea hybrida]|nr:hypothetical protein BDD12DRAFT_827786 [Trichophaea hybrida]